MTAVGFDGDGLIVAGGGGPTKGESRTHLAIRLAPPQRPYSPTRRLIIVLALFSGIVSGLFVADAITKAGGYDPATPVRITAGLVWVALAVGLPYVAWLTTDNLATRDKATEARYAERLSGYLRAYYCHRDDIAFDPAVGQALLPETFRARTFGLE